MRGINLGVFFRLVLAERNHLVLQLYYAAIVRGEVRPILRRGKNNIQNKEKSQKYQIEARAVFAYFIPQKPHNPPPLNVLVQINPFQRVFFYVHSRYRAGVVGRHIVPASAHLVVLQVEVIPDYTIRRAERA